MAPPRKPKPEFPPDCCGVCRFSRNGGEAWECWVSERKVVIIDGVAGWTTRPAPIDSPLDPACGRFLPRMNA